MYFIPSKYINTSFAEINCICNKKETKIMDMPKILVVDDEKDLCEIL